MSGQSGWLFSIISMAGMSLMAAVYLFGMIVTFRRWHLGTAPRLGAIGFALLFVVGGLQAVFNVLMPILLPPNDSSDMFLRLMVANSFFTLLTVAGLTLVVLALWTALRDYERARNA